MRRSAGWAIVLACGAAAIGAAHAAEPSPAFALAPPTTASDPAGDPIGALLTKAEPQTDSQALDWRSGEVRFAPTATLRIRVANPADAQAARLSQLPGYGGGQAYELSLVRDWPAALSFDTGGFGLDFTPHAGVGVTSYGGLAEAGATLQLSQRMSNAVVAGLGAMGVRDGAKLDGRGRWYLFAAASGRAVGLNMLHGDAGWARGGWTTDPTSTLVGDAQLGVGWRKGALQTSVGFVHREMKGLHTLYGQDPKADSLVAVSVSLRPRR